MTATMKLRVVRPCGKDWNSMTGDDKTRFCPDCGKNVHNVSALTRREGAELIAADGTVPCLRGVAAQDGTLMSIGQLAASNRRQFTQTILTALPFARLAAAQTTGGTLRGVVTDHIGTLLEGCDVKLTSADGTILHAKSKAGGSFELTDVPAGNWELQAVMPGFSLFRQSPVAIRENAETKVSFHLDIGTVGGGAPEVELKFIKRKLPDKLLLHK